MKWTYPISDLVPGAQSQAIGYSDRPLCAFTAAVASFARGNSLRGMASGLTDEQIEAEASATFAKANVPQSRAELWVRSLNGEHPATHPGWTPKDCAITASDYQIQALNALPIAGGCLGMRVGLGKTITAVTGACLAVARGQAQQTRCWILGPINSHGAWNPYIATLKNYFTNVEIISIDQAHKLDGAGNEGGVLIIDEGHMLGAMTARRTQAMHRLRPLFDVCYVLTGTFLHAGVEKALSMLDLAIPGAAQFSSRWKCGEHFRVLVKERIGARTITKLAKPTATRDQFLEYISRYAVMLDKDSPGVAEVAGIPEQVLETVKCGPFPSLDTLVTGICTACDIAGEGIPHAAEVMHLIARSGVDVKLDGWIKIVTDTSGMCDDPWVWFAHYTETLDHLEKFLVAAAVPYVRVDGSTSKKDRQEAQRKFQAGEVQIFLGQATAAGVAIDLFRACKSCTFDISWKAIDYAQLLGRTARRGSAHETCYHYDFVANPLQFAMVQRVRDSADFNAEAVEYQDTKRLLALRGCP
jgi:hypothetical protein